MNLQEVNVLRRLDNLVTAGGTGVVETQFGPVTVHPTRYHGYAAEILDDNGQKWVEFAHVPSAAFLRLGESVLDRASN